MFVCLCVHFFVIDFSGTIGLRILKFCTNVGNDKLYCVTKNRPHIAYQFLYYHFFCLSNKFFHHISLASMSARVFKFCIHDEDKQVYY